MNRVQFLDFFKRPHSKAQTKKKNQQKKNVLFFWGRGRAPKRYLKQSRTSMKPSLSIHLSVSLSLPRFLYHIYLSVILIFSLSLKCGSPQ